MLFTARYPGKESEHELSAASKEALEEVRRQRTEAKHRKTPMTRSGMMGSRSNLVGVPRVMDSENAEFDGRQDVSIWIFSI